MADRVTRRRDRALAVAVLVSFLLGLVCLALAICGVRHPPGDVPPIGYRQVSPVLGFVAGPIFIGFGIYELVHRLRNGPQPEGRHARSVRRSARR